MKKIYIALFISAVIVISPFFVSAATLGELQAQINALMAQVQALLQQLQLLQGQTSSTSSASSFTCGSPFTDSRGSKIYNTISIGNQCWMKENLNVGTKIAGSVNASQNSAIEKYCYNNDESKCASDGGLYQWDEAMGYSSSAGIQGICPSGWHVPTDKEFCDMAKAVDSSVSCDSTGYRGSNAGTKLKVGGSSGFEGVLAGVRDPAMGTSIFYDRGSNASFWTSSTSTDNKAVKWSLNSSLIGVGRYGATKTSGFSVRCVKDVDASVSASLSITTSPFLAPATQGAYYSNTIFATVVNGAYVWSATGLPAGLSLSYSGSSAEIKGIPTASSSFSVAVTVSAGGKTDSETFYLTVNSSGSGSGGGGTGGGGGGGASTSTVCVVNTNTTSSDTGRVGGTGALVLNVKSFSLGGMVSSTYTSMFSVGGGDGSNYTWSATGVPAGVNIGTSICPTCPKLYASLFGTPTAAGNYRVRVTVSSGGQSASKEYDLRICGNNASAGSSSSNSSAGSNLSQGTSAVTASGAGVATSDKEERRCIDNYCYGTNSKLVEVRNRDGRSNSSLGAVCCDGNWGIDARGSYWSSYCNNKGSADTFYRSPDWYSGFQTSEWYVCSTGASIPSASVASSSRSVVVSSPVQNESYNAGSSVFVNWATNGFAVPLYDLTVDMGLVPEGSLTGLWSAHTWNDGTEQWPIGENIAPGKYYVHLTVCEPNYTNCVGGNSQVFNVVAAGASVNAGGAGGKNTVVCTFNNGFGECSGRNSAITGISWNAINQGTICCDGDWWQKLVTVSCNGGKSLCGNWTGDCNGMGNGFNQGGFYQCRASSLSPENIFTQTASALRSSWVTINNIFESFENKWLEF